MNSRGFVYIDEILKFGQMQRLGASTNDMVKLTIESSHLELSRDQLRILTKQWRAFVTNPVISDTHTTKRSFMPFFTCFMCFYVFFCFICF